jgi:hypothetical protein
MAQQYFEVGKGFKINNSVWISGAGAPSGSDATAAHIGSFWTDETNGLLYFKDATGWVVQASKDYVDTAVAGVTVSTDDVNIQTFIGKGAYGAEMPTYATNYYVVADSNLEQAISVLDDELHNTNLNVTSNDNAIHQELDEKIRVWDYTAMDFTTPQIIAELECLNTSNVATFNFDLIVLDSVNSKATQKTYEYMYAFTNFDFSTSSHLLINSGVDYTLTVVKTTLITDGFEGIQISLTSATADACVLIQKNNKFIEV